MRSAILALALLLTAASAQAKAHKLLLFPVNTDRDAVTAQVGELGENALALYDALPRCGDGTLPCAISAKRHQKFWQGSGATADDLCESPTVYPIVNVPINTSVTIAVRRTANCSLRLARYRRLHFPRNVLQPLAGLSFGDAAAGVDFQPNVRQGYKINRLIWARGAVRKNGINLTRTVAGAYFTEQWGNGAGSPVCYTTSWVKEASTSGSGPWTKFSQTNYTPQTAVAPYQIAAEVVGGFKNFSNNTHWSDSFSTVGPNQIKNFRCTFGGYFPADSTNVCEIRFTNTSQPAPL